MSRVWTKAQQAAIRTRGRTLLVSAAAGSGKTATLTQRIIARLTDTEHPAQLSRMLIVTFTRAAAAELKERISQALTEAIAQHPDSHHLQKQLMEVGNAHISTIDAFCMEPLRTHFAEAGLPASFRIADEAELAPLSERVMDELMDLFYKKYAPPQKRGAGQLFSLLEGNDFADLCDALSASRNDDMLPSVFRELYNRLLTYPAGLERLHIQAQRLLTQADGDFLASDHGAPLRAWVHDFAQSAVTFYQEALTLLETDAKALRAYGPSFTYEKEFVQRLQSADSYAEITALLAAFSPPALKPLIGAAPEIVSLKERRNGYKKCITDTFGKQLFAEDAAKIAQDMRKTARMCEVLYDFLTTYDTRMTMEKRQRGLCDFTDNRRLLLQLLRQADGSPSALAEEYRAAFDEVYIDEYQDVDEVQDTIFSLIGGQHRFMVGDIKQSIYSFRGADPSVFSSYRKHLPPLDLDEALTDREEPPVCVQDKDSSTGNSLFMSDNFRCDESVIRVTNGICGHVFRACPDTIHYLPEDDLGFAKQPPRADYISPRVEIDILYKDKPEQDTAEDAADSSEGHRFSDNSREPFEERAHEPAGTDTEYIHVARRIASLLSAGETLANGDPITPGDIAILMRTRAGLAKMSAALAAQGIPTGCEELESQRAGQNLLKGPEMRYLMNVLRVLDNPDSDGPLSEVLQAPFPGFDVSHLVAFRRAGAGSLYDGLVAYPKTEAAEASVIQRVVAFTAWLDRYRTLCTTLPADNILRLLRQDACVSSRRSRAFLYLYDAARTCRVGSFTGVYSFLRYMERKLATARDGPAENSKPSGGYVSLMTIHRAKGLEFPVCFVIRCGARFDSGRRGSADLLFDKQTGIGMSLFDRAGGRKYTTALLTSCALATQLSEREDEMRILYVAMTRARERLYLSGIGKETPSATIPSGDRYATLSASCYMDWITAALSAQPHLATYTHVQTIPLSSVTPGVPLPRRAVVGDGPGAATAAYYRRLQQNLPTPDSMESLLMSVPTKVPASRMTEDMLDQCVFFSSERPVGDEDKLPDSERGIAGCDPKTLAAIHESLRLMESTGRNEFELLLAEGRKPTAAERGTATHLFLQFCSFARMSADKNGSPLVSRLEQEIARLLTEGFIHRRTAEILDRARLIAFFSGDFFARICVATRIRRELRFHRFLPLATLTRNPALQAALGERTLYVQGSIDLLCEYEDGRLLLCDYKTDRVTTAERADPALLRAHLQERHGPQLAQYAAAIQEMYGRMPDEMYIYAVSLDREVRMDTNTVD